LSYADVWHPRWKATVNGRRVRVERANLAYKAVALDRGANVVEFRFDPGRARDILLKLYAVEGLLVVGLAAWLTARLGV
jgi:uncharacterized membrane protein YfhO